MWLFICCLILLLAFSFLFNCCLIDIFVAPSTCSTLHYSTVLYISLVGRLLLGNRLPSVDFWSVGQTYILKFQILAGFRCFYSFCFIGLPPTQSKNLTLSCQCAPTAGDRYELPEHLGCPFKKQLRKHHFTVKNLWQGVHETRLSL